MDWSHKCYRYYFKIRQVWGWHLRPQRHLAVNLLNFWATAAWSYYQRRFELKCFCFFCLGSMLLLIAVGHKTRRRRMLVRHWACECFTLHQHWRNPDCRMSTVGPNALKNKSTLIGEEAHITAASENGPRYDGNLYEDKRSDSDNAIWLCSNCPPLAPHWRRCSLPNHQIQIKCSGDHGWFFSSTGL